jgi:hypothetical protein
MRTNKTLGLVVLVVVTLLVLMGVTGIRSQSRSTSASGLQDDATPIQEGRMTDKQREHSKLYKGYGTGKKLKEIARETSARIAVVRNTPMPVGESGDPTSLSQFVNRLVCRADAVIIGTVKNRASQLTEDGEFIFTDYDLNVEEVLKDDIHSHLAPNVNLALTQPGGRVQLDGQMLEAEDKSFKPLLLGRRYILFVKFIQSTRAYTPSNSTSTYELSDNRISAQTEEPLAFGLNGEKSSVFLEIVRAETASKCPMKGGQK